MPGVREARVNVEGEEDEALFWFLVFRSVRRLFGVVLFNCVQGVFPKMSYFGVKHGHFRPFLSKKRDFQSFSCHFRSLWV